MSYEIRNINEIDKSNIKLGKTFKYSLSDNYHLTNIYYINESNKVNTNKVNTNKLNTIILKENTNTFKNDSDDKTKLIIQTPLMYIPNSIIYFNDKPFLELSFNNEDNDKDVVIFKNWIYNLELYIYNLIKKRTSLNVKKENMISIVKQKNVNYSNSSTKLLVPINMNISKCILNDDLKKSKFLFNWKIPVPTYGISILWVKNIWIKNDKWGINLFMYASRVMNSHILDPLQFLDSDNDNKSIKKYEVVNKFKDNEKMSIQVGQIPEYIMFFKMLKMGIPKAAIKQKIDLTGLDNRVIDYPEDTSYVTVLHYMSNPQLGPYNKNISESILNTSPPTVPSTTILKPNILNQSLKLDLLKNITSGGFTLKKVDNNEISQTPTNIKDKVLNNINNNNGLKVPTLCDIQGALSKLKKIDLDC